MPLRAAPGGSSGPRRVQPKPSAVLDRSGPRRTSCRVRGGGRSTTPRPCWWPPCGMWPDTPPSLRRRRHQDGHRHQPGMSAGHNLQRAIVAEAADGQSAGGSGSLQLPYSSSRPPSGPAATRRAPVPVSGEDAQELGGRIEALAGPDAPRFLGVSKLVDDHHPHGSYYYLQFLGVAPGRQGQGIGAALMAPVLERCDREGMRAYLDATSERSKTLYERHGFEAEAAFALPGGRRCGRCGRWPALGR
jgi:GNAT superfamily N-acetyltransferase